MSSRKITAILKVDTRKLDEALAKAKESGNLKGISKIAKVISPGLTSAMILGQLASVNADVASVLYLVNEAESWLYKLMVLTQQKPDELKAFLADNYDITLPVASDAGDFLARLGSLRKKAERFNWVAEKLYRYYLSEGKLPKKGDPLVVAYKEYIPFDWGNFRR